MMDYPYILMVVGEEAMLMASDSQQALPGRFFPGNQYAAETR